MLLISRITIGTIWSRHVIRPESQNNIDEERRLGITDPFSSFAKEIAAVCKVGYEVQFDENEQSIFLSPTSSCDDVSGWQDLNPTYDEVLECIGTLIDIIYHQIFNAFKFDYISYCKSCFEQLPIMSLEDSSSWSNIKYTYESSYCSYLSEDDWKTDKENFFDKINFVSKLSSIVYNGEITNTESVSRGGVFCNFNNCADRLQKSQVDDSANSNSQKIGGETDELRV